MSSAARTILVTGFEPFGGETVNASWEAARRLEGWRHGEYAAVARLLPCAYDASVKELVLAIETLRPDALLMTGQAARRGVVCVERFAHNLDDAAAPDNDGALRRALRISRDAPEWLEAAAPVTAIVRRDQRGGNSGPRVDERRRLRLQPPLFRRARIICAASGRRSPRSSCICPQTPEQTPARANARRLTAAKAADALRAAAAAMVAVPGIAPQREAAQ